MRNRLSDLRTPRSDALPLSHKKSLSYLSGSYLGRALRLKHLTQVFLFYLNSSQIIDVWYIA